jgi:dienelactone hydrolase
MKDLVLILSIAVGTFLPFPIHAESGTINDLPSRIELLSFSSLWIPDQQFLTGNEQGKEVALTGELSLPQRQGKVPLVILMHGSTGISAYIPYWVRHLNEIGVATFVIDGFSGRGLTEVGTNQAVLGRLNFIIDIFRSLAVLAKHPRIDPDRIAVMGFSRGGQASLFSAMKRFDKLWNKSGTSFAAYIAFYPDCSTTYKDDTAIADKPIRIFHGTADNYDPIEPCRSYVSRLKQAGHNDVTLTEYPNAPHNFDNPLGAIPAAPGKGHQSVRDCAIREGADGTLINAETGSPFSYDDQCVKLGPLLGADPEAREAARSEVTQFLQAAFGLH